MLCKWNIGGDCMTLTLPYNNGQTTEKAPTSKSRATSAQPWTLSGRGGGAVGCHSIPLSLGATNP